MAARFDPAVEGWEPVESWTFIGSLGSLWRRPRLGSDPAFDHGLLLGPHCINRRGQVHGGVVASFADYVGGLPLLELAPETGNVTVNLDVNFINVAPSGSFLTGSGWIVTRKNSLAFLRGEIRCDDTLIASFSIIMKRIRADGSAPAIG